MRTELGRWQQHLFSTPQSDEGALVRAKQAIRYFINVLHPCRAPHHHVESSLDFGMKEVAHEGANVWSGLEGCLFTALWPKEKAFVKVQNEELSLGCGIWVHERRGGRGRGERGRQGSMT